MTFPLWIDGTRRRPKLPRMPLVRLYRLHALARAACGLLVALLVLGACERTAPAGSADSGAAAPQATLGGGAPARNRSGWNPAAGPTLLVQGATIDDAIAIFPFADDTLDQALLDSMSSVDAPAALLGRGGARFTARLGALPDETDAACERWLLRDVQPQGAGRAWAVGFVDARVASIALDSVDVLTPRDSAMLVAEASRLASTISAPASPSFQGLRFTAHDVRRFVAAPGIDAFVAHLVRHVNQEASPREEQTLLVAERPRRDAPYRVVYSERSAGREETVVAPEVLAAVRFGDRGAATLVVARESEIGVVYALLERTVSGSWRVRWTSPASQCS